jgi:hypothetical protein
MDPNVALPPEPSDPSIIQLELLDRIKTNNIARFHELVQFIDPQTSNTMLLEEAINCGNRYFAGVLAFKMKYNARVDWNHLKTLAEKKGDSHMISLVVAHGAPEKTE